MDADFRYFNALGPKGQAQLIIAAGAKARGQTLPAPKGEAPDKAADLAVMIIRAGQRRRGELP